MSPTEVLPLLVVALLLLSASGVEPETMEVVFDGTHEVDAIDDALVVGGGTVTVPANATVRGQLYVVGGDVRVDGRLEGDLVQLAGGLSVTGSATIAGTLRTIAGDAAVAEGASVARRTAVDVTPRPRSPLVRGGLFVVRVLATALAAAWLARRSPALLDNVGDSITGHAVVSGVVGSLAGATLLVLFVYMAFTLVLIPLSVVGLLVELLMVAYGYLAFGHVIGRRLPVERVDVASALGVGVFLVGLELLSAVPILGGIVQLLLAAVGLGAVSITYFGLKRFEPPEIPG